MRKLGRQLLNLKKTVYILIIRYAKCALGVKKRRSYRPHVVIGELELYPAA